MVGEGERATMPSVSSLFRCYSKPKTTIFELRLYFIRPSKRTVIPSESTSGQCEFFVYSLIDRPARRYRVYLSVSARYRVGSLLL